MIRVAAVGDVHYDRSTRKEMREHFLALRGRADLLLMAGDLTQSGNPEEARALAFDLRDLSVPVVAVLGNHDYHQNREEEIRAELASAGVICLEGESTELRVHSTSVGIAGVTGFGGGFFGACVTEFGEAETKSFAHFGREQADILRRQVRSLDTDYRFALLHYAPVEGTLLGERRELFPFLGCHLLAEAIDEAQIDAVFHGHAHRGSERGETPGGVPVRNVAMMVIRHSYNIYTFEKHAR
ncbi:MAG: metallophosphoesterase [Oligoflexia bacterium]|nr:metallophosphoesterase [Oligoflexia bacterium]